MRLYNDMVQVASATPGVALLIWVWIHCVNSATLQYAGADSGFLKGGRGGTCHVGGSGGMYPQIFGGNFRCSEGASGSFWTPKGRSWLPNGLVETHKDNDLPPHP